MTYNAMLFRLIIFPTEDEYVAVSFTFTGMHKKFVHYGRWGKISFSLLAILRYIKHTKIDRKIF